MKYFLLFILAVIVVLNLNNLVVVIGSVFLIAIVLFSTVIITFIVLLFVIIMVVSMAVTGQCKNVDVVNSNGGTNSQYVCSNSKKTTSLFLHTPGLLAPRIPN